MTSVIEYFSFIDILTIFSISISLIAILLMSICRVIIVKNTFHRYTINQKLLYIFGTIIAFMICIVPVINIYYLKTSYFNLIDLIELKRKINKRKKVKNE